MMDEIVNELKTTLCKSPTRLYSVCQEFLQLMDEKEKPQQVLYFKAFLTEISVRDMGEELPENFLGLDMIPQKDRQELLQLKNRMIFNLIQARVDEDVFYSTLWEKMMDPALISNIESRAAFLQYLWIDNRIPYYKLGEGCSMDNESYQAIVKRIQPSLNKAYFILNADLEYKTQRASLLLDVAGTLKDSQEQIVFWGVLIARLQRQVQLLSETLEELKETCQDRAEEK